MKLFLLVLLLTLTGCSNHNGLDRLRQTPFGTQIRQAPIHKDTKHVTHVAGII